MIKKVEMKLLPLKGKLKKIVTDNSGQGSVETAIQILIAVVLGALILAGLYALMDDTILPTLTQKIQEMFNYTN